MNIAQYCGSMPGRGKRCITVVITASSEEIGSSGRDKRDPDTSAASKASSLRSFTEADT